MLSSDCASQTLTSPEQPEKLKAFIFVDGQNLFKDTERAFAAPHPEFDISKLSNSICSERGWEIKGINFYTGTPTAQQNDKYRVFWDNKLRAMERSGVKTFPRVLKYRANVMIVYDKIRLYFPMAGGEYTEQGVDSPWSTKCGLTIPEYSEIEKSEPIEKGIDVSIAVDMIKCAISSAPDVILLFSRDNDLVPAIHEVKRIGILNKKPILVATTYPELSDVIGIKDTKQITFNRSTYESSKDIANYFPRRR